MAEAAARIGNFLLQILLVRALAPVRYGVFAYAYSLFFVVIALTSLGISEAFIREGSIERERIGSVLSGFFSLRVLSAAVAAVIIAGVAAASGADGPVIFAVGLFLLFRSVTAFLATVFRAREVIRKEFLLRLAETAAIVGVGAAALAMRWTLSMVVWTLAAAAAACTAAAIVAFRFRVPGFSWSLPAGAWRRMMAAAPYGLPAVAGGWLLRIDVAAFQKLGHDPVRTAYFAAAVNLVLAAGLVPAIASAALYPALARGERGTGVPVGRVLLLFSGAGAGLAALLRFEPDLLVRWAYGARYMPAAAWLALLAPFLFFLSPCIFAASVLAARGEAAVVCGVLLIPLAGNAASTLALYPYHPNAVVPVTVAWEAVAAISAAVFVYLSASRSRQL